MRYIFKKVKVRGRLFHDRNVKLNLTDKPYLELTQLLSEDTPEVTVHYL